MTEASAGGPFKLNDIVETVKGAKFWGEIIAFDTDQERPGCTVMAIAPGFEGTKHVYPLAQLQLRAGGIANADVVLPKAMTPPIEDVLSTMLWDSGRIARAYREVGVDIPPKAEVEQAFFLFRALRYAILRGAEWRKAVVDELTAMQAAKTASAKESGAGGVDAG